MAGYCGYSMSNNAVYAYESGKKPLSKWTKAEMIEQAKPFLTCSVTLFKKLTVAEMKECCLSCTEWHHTGKFYNKTDFYSLNEDWCEELTDEKIMEIISHREPKKKKEEPKEIKATVIFLEWSGTRNHPHAKEVTMEGVIKGNWFYYSYGFGTHKKSINARGFKILSKEEETC